MLECYSASVTECLSAQALKYSSAQALEHFSELVRRFPDYQAGWNNLATGMEELGCTEAAEQVRACAANHSQNGIHVGADAACTIPVCR